jgi:hypothetical protein
VVVTGDGDYTSEQPADGPVRTAYSYGGGRLREVLFLNNRLTGCVPEAQGFLPCIQVLDLSNNRCRGTPSSAAAEVRDIGSSMLSPSIG